MAHLRFPVEADKLSEAKYNKSGTITCMWDHPVYGPIPFTANPDDPELHGRMIFDLLKDIAEPYTEPGE